MKFYIYIPIIIQDNISGSFSDHISGDKRAWIRSFFLYQELPLDGVTYQLVENMVATSIFSSNYFNIFPPRA